MANKRRGRPPKKQSRSESLLVRLEPVEKKAFQHAALVSGVPVAVWVRERLRRAAIHDLDQIGVMAEFLRDIGNEE